MVGQSGVARQKLRQRRGHKSSLALYCILSFGCGMGLLCLLMALFAFLMAKAPIPPQASRPLASLAAAAGVAMSSYVLAGKLGSRYLLCGLGCGAFYLVCLVVVAVLYTGEPSSINAASVSMPTIMLLLGGILGGTAASLKGTG